MNEQSSLTVFWLCTHVHVYPHMALIYSKLNHQLFAPRFVAISRSFVCLTDANHGAAAAAAAVTAILIPASSGTVFNVYSVRWRTNGLKNFHRRNLIPVADEASFLNEEKALNAQKKKNLTKYSPDLAPYVGARV